MQETFQAWRILLEITGRKLNLSKCAFYAWENTLNMSFKPQDKSIKIFLPESISIPHIKKLRPQEDIKYIGIQTNLRCKWTQDFHRRYLEIQQYAHRVSNYTLTPQEMCIDYHFSILDRIRY